MRPMYATENAQAIDRDVSTRSERETFETRRRVRTDRLRIRHYAENDSVFIDDEYVIRGLAGRIFVRLLCEYEREGRLNFTNKELRVDRSLELRGYRDNLEARLSLLRTRLEERGSAVRLARTGRGRFRLELSRAFDLVCAL